MTTRDAYWRIDDIPIDGHEGPESVHTLGESYTLTVTLTSKSDSDAGAWFDYVDRYRTLREYRPHAGQYDTYEALDGTIHFREQHDRSPSLLVALRPPVDTRTGVGMWALVSAVEDQTTLPSALCQLDIELAYLAPLGDYADKQAVRADLEADGPAPKQ